MTARKCRKYRLRPGEFADGERYTRAMREALTCWRCRCWMFVMEIAWRLGL
jgi:hypothetical protein